MADPLPVAPPSVPPRRGAPLGGGGRPSPYAPRRTLLFLLGAFVLFTAAFASRAGAPTAALLEDAARTAVVLVEGRLEIELGLRAPSTSVPRGSLDAAAAALVRVRRELEVAAHSARGLARSAEHVESARELGLRALVLRAEAAAGEDLELVDELERYARERRGEPALTAFLRAHRATYGTPASAPTGSASAEELEAVRELAGSLSGDLLAAALLRADGRTKEADDVEATRRARELARAASARHLLFVAAGVLGIGIVLALLSRLLGLGTTRLARAELPPGDSTPLGFDIFARGLFGFQVVGVAAVALARLAGANVPLGVAGLLAWAPLVVLTVRRVGPGMVRTARAFGLGVERTAWVRLVAVALAVFAVEIVGFLALSIIGRSFGGDWTSPAEELWLLGTAAERIGLALEALVWAPLFEELAFRGLLFGALRSRMSFTGAALASSLLFAAVHPYGAEALLPMTWLGLVLCFTYERTRSLVPCVLVHVFHNGATLAALSVLAP